MTAQAITSLLEWARKHSAKEQKAFAKFYAQKVETFKYDESCGGNPQGTVNMTVLERMLQVFEGQQ